MTRIRLPLGRTLFFLSAFLFCVVALLPLRLAIDWLALDERGFSARGAEGSIWLGTLRQARLGAVPLGDLSVRLRSLPLLAGRARLDLHRGDEANPFKGAVTVSRHAFGVDDVTGRLPVASLFAPLPVGALDLDDLTARFANGACVSAEGRVQAVLAGQVAGLALPGGLAGNARCDGGALLLPLVSQTGLETLDIRLFGDGRYLLELGLRPTDPAFAERLAAAGFAAGANGAFVTRVEGRFSTIE